MECWNNTLVFFEKILLGQMRNYVAVQMNVRPQSVLLMKVWHFFR
jgi:hypothetical protein